MRRRPLGALTLLSACLAAATLTGCGGQGRDGFVAVGGAGAGPERSAGQTVPPEGGVELQPLAGPSAGSPAGPSGASGTSTTTVTTGTTGTSGTGGTGGTAGTPPGTTGPGGDPGPGRPGTPGATPPATGTPPGTGTPSDPDDPTAPAPPRPGTPTRPPATEPPTGRPPTAPAPGPTPPASPAKLVLGTPTLADTGERRCEQVTVRFTNTGGTAVRSGTVTFTVDILGDLLGARWGTVTSEQPLPAPLAGGAARNRTYTVCVEAWRVPLGWHIDTRQVTATWR
ncbi:hypothetical protein [Streptomyces sp. NPDC089799]|uniref:hypothetical protein n=1 Tax=Streptomyces sp. NPDC089799 TaxID=3155066 RepID=UPI0034266EDD